MKKFEQLVCVDNTRLTQEALEKLSGYSQQQVRIFHDYPSNNQEIIDRINDADAVLVSWKTRIDAEVIAAAKNLKYIGMCCSLIDKKSANVSIDAAEQQDITVKGVRDYGDEGVVEFILAQLISLAKGLGTHQWKAQPTELKGKTLGIVGFGTVGQMLAKTALAFGMKILYYSRTRKISLESEQIKYADLEQLLKESDVVSTHLPRHTKLMSAHEFGLMKPNSVFINTSVGPTFESEPLLTWLAQAGHFAIFDADGAFSVSEDLVNHPSVLYTPKTTGMTDAAFERLSQKVLANIEAYLSE